MHKALGILALAACVITGCDNPLGLKPGATSILSGMQRETPAEAADMALDPYDADRRYRGTLLLASGYFAGEAPYIALFEQRINDKDPGVRAAATRALGMHGLPTHVPMIVERLSDTDPGVRVEAARALQRLHNPAAVSPLIDRIDPAREQEVAVRVEAAAALGQYPEPRVVEKLIASLDDQSLAVNAATASSLRSLTGQDFGYDRAGWQGWYKDSKGLFAAQNVYVYRGFEREKKWHEYFPFVPPPPHEPGAVPTGLNPGQYTPAGK